MNTPSGIIEIPEGDHPDLIVEGGAEWAGTGPRALVGITYRGMDRRERSRVLMVSARVGVGAGRNGMQLELVDLEIRPYSFESEILGGEPVLFQALPISIERDVALSMDSSVSIRLIGLAIEKESDRAFVQLAMDAVGLRAYSALAEGWELAPYAYGADAQLGGKFPLDDIATIRVTYLGGEIKMGRVLSGQVFSRLSVDFHRMLHGFVEGGWRMADYGAFTVGLSDEELASRRFSTRYLRIGIEARL